MSAKEEAIKSLEHAKIAIDASENLSKEQKQELHKNIEYSMSNIPDAKCSSPEMVLAVGIMREAYLEAVKALMLSVTKS
jgi:hypothetical protein